MDPASTERLAQFKEQFPEMDLPMVQFFARAMTGLHDMTSMMELYFSKMNLSKGRFMVLIQLYAAEGDGLNISDVMTQYRVSSATMTGIIDTLEKEGLIERLRSPSDRRRVNLRLTDSGRRFMDDFLPRHHEYMRRFTSRLDTDERADLLRMLELLRSGIGEAVAEIEQDASGDDS